jgi:hypothetical protein
MGSEWKPIETAPKDGTPILALYADAWGMRRYSVRYWSTGNWESGKEGWSDEWRQLRKDQPTHWQPLPPPPGDTP